MDSTSSSNPALTPHALNNNNTAPTFDTQGDGIVVTALKGDGVRYIGSCIIQDDGKILVSGTGTSSFLVRYDPDGSLDESFDFVPSTAGIGCRDVSAAVIFNGKIWMSTSDHQYSAVLGFNADGSVATDFGTNGMAVTTDYGQSRIMMSRLAVQTDGSILIAGNTDDSYFVTHRFTPEGTVDRSFGNDGRVVIPSYGPIDGFGCWFAFSDLTVQPDGKIVAAGSRADDLGSALARYNTDGTLDSSFGEDGLVATCTGGVASGARSVSVLQNGKLLVGGWAVEADGHRCLALAQYNNDGSLDTGFGFNGLVKLASSSKTIDLVVQPDGKIVMVGWHSTNLVVTRLNPDGSLDSRFGTEGFVMTDCECNFWEDVHLALQPDGKIVVAGQSLLTDYKSGLMVARYNPDGSPDTSFGASSVDERVLYAGTPVVLDSAVSVFDRALADVGNYSGASVMLARRGGASDDDVFSASGNLSFSEGQVFLSGTQVGTVSNKDGKLVITFNGNATQARVNETLSSIAYANISAEPPLSVAIEWQFSDGGSNGTPGVGHALTAVAATRVDIEHAPTGSITVVGVPKVGARLQVSDKVTDIDGVVWVEYEWQSSSDGITGWYPLWRGWGDEYTPTTYDRDKHIRVVATCFDGNGTAKSVVSNAVLVTDGGAVVVTGTSGNDNLAGTSNNDTINGLAGDDLFVGDFGNDVLNGGDGSDTADYSTNYWNGVSANLAWGQVWTREPGLDTLMSIENLRGTPGDDILVGDANANRFETHNGADTLTGGDGSDTFVLHRYLPYDPITITDFDYGAGGDVLDPGDLLRNLFNYSSAQNPFATGHLKLAQRGGDTLLQCDLSVGASGGPSLYMRTLAILQATPALAVTSANFSGGFAPESPLSGLTVIGTAGNDTLTGGSLDDSLVGGLGNDSLYGGPGDDTYRVDGQGDLVFDFIDCGFDTVYSSTSFYLYPNIEQLVLTGTAYFGVGTDIANVLIGNDQENLLIAWSGDDALFGGAARDALYGVDGNDTIVGEAGIDYLIGGLGNDVIYGGADADEIYGQEGNDRIFGGPDAQTDTLVGGDGNDTIDGGLASDQVYGNAGDDVFYVSQQVDWVFEQPGEGTDTVYADSPNGFYLYANLENLILLGNTPYGVGNELPNILVGNRVGNTLLGGDGNDTLNGGAGSDILYGQGGNDVFVIQPGTQVDILADFTLGQDRIDVTAFGFGTLANAKAAMTQVGGDIAFNLANGDLVIIQNVGVAALTSAEFVL